MKPFLYKLPFIVSLFLFFNTQAQTVTITEEIVPISTYSFSHPNPVPIVAENPKIPPYFKFESYEHTSKKKNWKVVTLENDYIKVSVLPEIGGKVWGAIEKSTGEEFLYKNEVIKFRNIAMRGPWTSGGIEFNFGIIGHHPSTATPVDYVTKTNEDGSVSCIVGSTDLSSNTEWRVEIRLEKDKAYFETNVSWYNASPIDQSYYNWMTAAAVATYDLEFFIPGNAYVQHNGNAHSWPIDDQGRDLSFYKNNTFGPSKSYHIVGEYNDFFGGYYHDSKFGFGQWAPYEEMPGQKLWLWDLSRGGGIWEDLLTDSDGQYIEFQAGRLFDQYSPGAAINPISQVGFAPYGMDRWSEIWFPYKEIGGMVDASPEGVLNVEIENGQVYIGLNPLQKLDTQLKVSINGKATFSEELDLKPMEVYSKTITANVSDTIEVYVEGTDLDYTNDPESKKIKRPFYPDENLKVSKSEQLFQEGSEAMEYRAYEKAHEKLSELIGLDPSHRAGLTKLAQLEYRKTNYTKALELANAVLKMDTYDPEANYIVGITYRALDDTINALESLGWAARDMRYRSVSFAQMAEIYLSLNNYKRARKYAYKALDFNTYSINARQVLLIVARKQKNSVGFKQQYAAILQIDALDHFTKAEMALMENTGTFNTATISGIKNEFPEESILAMALRYKSLVLVDEAIEILQLSTSASKNKLWLSYLLNKKDKTKSDQLMNELVSASPNFVFPYRRETIPVLEWATKVNDSWKLKYYLAQNYLAVGQKEKGEALLKVCGYQPDSDVFYRFRAKVLSVDNYSGQLNDHKKAYELNKKDWKVWEEYIQFYLKNGNDDKAYGLSSKAYKKFKGNYNIGLSHAKASLRTNKFDKSIAVLNKINILPFEHASESRDIYESAHVQASLLKLKQKKYKEAIAILERSKEWPESIGVGKPYNPDEREQNYLLALAYEETGQKEKAQTLLTNIVSYSEEHTKRNTINHLFGLLALKKLGKEKDLKNLLSELEGSVGEKNNRSALGLAFYKNDGTALKQLKSKKVISNGEWNMAVWALEH